MPSDKQLVAHCLQGDRLAFDQLMVKHQSRLRSAVGQYYVDSSLTSDITQQAFLNAFRYLGQFRGECAFYTWLYRIALNVAKHYLRRYRDTTHTENAAGIETLLAQQGLYERIGPEQWLCYQELEAWIINTLDDFSWELRTALLLHVCDGLSYADIARVMQCPVGTVRSRIFRARLLLEKQLVSTHDCLLYHDHD